MTTRGRSWTVVMASFVLAISTCARPPGPHPADRGEGGPGRGTLVIHATGDVSLDPEQIPVFATRGYGWAWSGLRDLFTSDDLTVVNLECPATALRDPVRKAFTFRCDPAALPAAREAGVDVVSQANNHAYDEG